MDARVLNPQRVRPHADQQVSLHAHDLQPFHHVHISEPRTGGIQHLPGLRSSLLAPAQVRTQPDRGFRVHPDLCVCGTLLGVRQLIDDLTHERVRIDAHASGAFGSDDVLRQVQWVVDQPEYAQQPTRRSQLLDLHRVPVAAKIALPWVATCALRPKIGTAAPLGPPSTANMYSS